MTVSHAPLRAGVRSNGPLSRPPAWPCQVCTQAALDPQGCQANKLVHASRKKGGGAPLSRSRPNSPPPPAQRTPPLPALAGCQRAAAALACPAGQRRSGKRTSPAQESFSGTPQYRFHVFGVMSFCATCTPDARPRFSSQRQFPVPHPGCASMRTTSLNTKTRTRTHSPSQRCSACSWKGQRSRCRMSLLRQQRGILLSLGG